MVVTGQLTAEVRGPGGIVPVTVEGFGGQRSVTFTPQGEGKILILPYFYLPYILTCTCEEWQFPAFLLIDNLQLLRKQVCHSSSHFLNFYHEEMDRVFLFLIW